MELGGQSCFRPGAGEIKSVLLRLDILVCNLEPALETAQLRIDAPYVAQEDHENIAAVLFCSRRVCCGRLHPPARSSQNIQFPRNGKASPKIVECDRHHNGRIFRSDRPAGPPPSSSAASR